ncbi:MAG: DNA polymerase III subunit alpha [Candidatus Kerfeldbacteria bacterium]|nr:DNA polymerase III subunit alpha [Candidatus Kerfeldbacteria bacterium]
MQFVHLHTHSHYSLLDGLPKIDELVQRAVELKMPALALTDHGALYGAVEFYQRAKTVGLKPIIGVETYVAPGSRRDRQPNSPAPYHLTLLARTTEGYRNLLKLITAAHLEGFYYKPRIDEELLAQYGTGLTALSGCVNGSVARKILSGDLREAERTIARYQEFFDGHYYLELQPNAFDDQQRVNAGLRSLSATTGAPLVVTADSHYLNRADAEAHDVLLCIQTKKQKNDPDRLSMLDEDYSLISGDEMVQRMPEDRDAIARTVEMADSCDVEIELGKIRLPHFDVPNGQTPDDHLRALCREGIAKRYGSRPSAEVQKRLDYELGVIRNVGFAPFFLIVQDFVNWAKQQGIVVGPGRGSAAGSIVAYLTNITNVDPIKYELFFERFLNPDRVSMPDFDIDFADTRRSEVIRYVESKYGADHVSQIITFGTMAARAAVRDVGRVLGFPYTYCDRLAKLIPFGETLAQAVASVPELKDIVANDPEGKKLIETAQRLEGVARHASTHACGVVIAKEPLVNTVPLQHGTTDDHSIITQYSLHPIEDLGLLKVDFLGLANLTILEHAIESIEQTRGERVNLDAIPLTDAKTYKLLQAGQTTGVFQLESSGMRRYLRALKPTELEDIIAMVSLYRPGPMELIPDFIAGKHGKKSPTYLDTRLKPILEKTHGIAVYQEQIMQIARDLAGFSLGEADVLRKAVGKKIAKLLKEQKTKFVAGCVNNGLAKGTAEKIFTFIEPFARYGFNRSHAACYALIAYQTAYFKANYPAQFMAALLTADHANSDKVSREVDECRTMGIPVLPPDVNESRANFTVIPNGHGRDAIRFGLSAIKNLGEGVIDAIRAEREADGPFEHLGDFLHRVTSKDLNRKSLESLIKAGALDRFGERRQMLENLEELVVFLRHAEKESRNGQTNLFGMLPKDHLPTLRLRPADPADRKTRLAWEKEHLGIYLSEHPLDEVADELKKIATPCHELEGLPNNRRVTVGGVVTSIQRVITKANEPMLFVRLEDTSGSVEVLVFPSTLKATASIWEEEQIVLVTGRLSDKDGVPKILAAEAKRFGEASSSPAARAVPAEPLVIDLTAEHATADLLTALKDVLGRFPGEQPVYLHVHQNGETKRIATTYRVAPSEEFRNAVRDIIGAASVKTSV